MLVVDPIDGTRPAMAGLESACVAVALAPLGDGDPTMADVEVGCVVEIKTGDWYLARRGGGVTTSRQVALSPTTDVSRMFWGYGFRGRPARETVEVLAELIDASSVGGGTFELGSQAFVDDASRDRPARRRGRGRLAARRRGARACGRRLPASAAARSSTTPRTTSRRRGCA